jgi:phosphomannomutase
MTRLYCFRAHDVRGRVPDELDEELAYKVGRAYATFLNPGRVPLGWDLRTSSLPLAAALAVNLTESGVEVLDLDLCGTEQVYFYFAHMNLGGASWSPPVINPRNTTA